MANTSAIWQRATHTTYQLSSPSCLTVISRGLTRENICEFFGKIHKNDQIKRARGLCRKTGFLHFNNSSFVASCEWIDFFKVKVNFEEINLVFAKNLKNR